MQIELSEQAADVVRRRIETGGYSDTAEVLEQALLEFGAPTEFAPGEFERLMAEAHQSVEERGWVPFEESIARARELIERHEASRRRTA